MLYSQQMWWIMPHVSILSYFWTQLLSYTWTNQSMSLLIYLMGKDDDMILAFLIQMRVKNNYVVPSFLIQMRVKNDDVVPSFLIQLMVKNDDMVVSLFIQLIAKYCSPQNFHSMVKIHDSGSYADQSIYSEDYVFTHVA